MSSTSSFNFSLILGALLGASSILLGAYGAHGLNDIFLKLPRMETAYSKAVDYQMYHSIVLVVLGVGSFIPNINLPRYLCFSFAGSVSLFSFPIYFWVFGGPAWLINLTPLGGIGLVFSWFLLIRFAWINQSKV